MPKGELFINGKDAYTEWGISMDNTSLSALMTPAPNKSGVENKSRLKDGKSVDNSNIKKEERDLTLQINLTAKNESDFFYKYDKFCDELSNGRLNIKNKYQPDKLYKMDYQSCSQFSQFMRGIAKFSLKLNEPNPNDRNIE